MDAAAWISCHGRGSRARRPLPVLIAAFLAVVFGGIVPIASPAAAISAFPGSCTGNWACVSSLALSGDHANITEAPAIYGWNYVAAESHEVTNTNDLFYPNGDHVGTNVRSVRNRNSGTSRSVFIYTDVNLGGVCRERPFDAITWQPTPAAISPNGRSLTVAPANSRPCIDF